LVLAATLATACGSQTRETAADANPAPPQVPDAATKANTAGTDGAQDRPRRTLTESDRLRLEMAEGACRSKDFGGFFRAFSGSWAVRERYTASEVAFGEVGKANKLTRRRYLDRNHYPLATIDYFYVTAETAMLFDANGGDSDVLRYVMIEINEASDGRARVDWLPGIFEKDLTPPPTEVGDGLGELVQETGSGGHLLFRPTTECWELVDDIANPPLEI
jgi:hypothetical protein